MDVRRGQDTPHRGRWLPASTALRRVGAGGGLGLWEAVITTGVMHQIRVHAAFVGLALAGDRLYGGGAPLDAAVVPGLPDGVPFLLHHVGLQGEDLAPPPCALPGFWPVR